MWDIGDVPTHVIVAPRHGVMSSVALALDVLGVAAAETAARGGPTTKILLASPDGSAMQCWHAMTLPVDAGIAEITSCELVWVAGFWGEPQRGVEANESLPGWLAGHRAAGALVAAHGPATFLLAEAGLLDGRLATTYIEHAAEFRLRYPAVNLQPSRLLTDGGGVFCSIGMNSGADLLVSLIERLHDPEVASSVAQWALVDSQRSYQSAMMAFDGQKYHGDADILTVQAVLEKRFGDALSLTAIAAQHGMSPRTLTRRFHAATGEPPSDYLARLRMAVAKELLRQTQLTIAEVAARVGYRDIGAFYDMFHKHVGLAPGRYRDAQPLISAATMSQS